MFRKKDKNKTLETEFVPILRTDEIGRLANELVLENKLGVSRDDYMFTVINILVELHPEIKSHPKMVQFVDKLISYEKITKRKEE